MSTGFRSVAQSNELLEELTRRPSVERALDHDIRRHDAAGAGHDEKQLAAVTAPFREHPSSCGDLPLGARHWKGLDVDFETARFVRCVCHPLTIWRKLPLSFFG